MHKAKSNELPASMNNLFQIANNPNYDLRSNVTIFFYKSRKQVIWKKVSLTMEQ